jgi:hypothetical protein
MDLSKQVKVLLLILLALLALVIGVLLIVFLRRRPPPGQRSTEEPRIPLPDDPALEALLSKPDFLLPIVWNDARHKPPDWYRVLFLLASIADVNQKKWSGWELARGRIEYPSTVDRGPIDRAQGFDEYCSVSFSQLQDAMIPVVRDTLHGMISGSMESIEKKLASSFFPFEEVISTKKDQVKQFCDVAYFDILGSLFSYHPEAQPEPYPTFCKDPNVKALREIFDIPAVQKFAALHSFVNLRVYKDLEDAPFIEHMAQQTWQPRFMPLLANLKELCQRFTNEELVYVLTRDELISQDIVGKWIQVEDFILNNGKDAIASNPLVHEVSTFVSTVIFPVDHRQWHLGYLEIKLILEYAPIARKLQELARFANLPRFIDYARWEPVDRRKAGTEYGDLNGLIMSQVRIISVHRLINAVVDGTAQGIDAHILDAAAEHFKYTAKYNVSEPYAVLRNCTKDTIINELTRLSSFSDFAKTMKILMCSPTQRRESSMADLVLLGDVLRIYHQITDCDIQSILETMKLDEIFSPAQQSCIQRIHTAGNNLDIPPKLKEIVFSSTSLEGAKGILFCSLIHSLKVVREAILNNSALGAALVVDVQAFRRLVMFRRIAKFPAGPSQLCMTDDITGCFNRTECRQLCPSNIRNLDEMVDCLSAFKTKKGLRIAYVESRGIPPP